jgi:exosortase
MAITEAPLATTPIRANPWPWAILAAGAALALAHLPLLVQHASQIWLRPHYQFFPLVLVGAVVLFARAVHRLGPLTPGSPVISWLVLGGAWGLLAVAEVLRSSWLGAVAALASLAALLFAVGGRQLLMRGLPALILLAVAIPPPFELDRPLVLSLQALTARWGSQVLDALGVFHVLAGHVVEVGGRQFLVEEACSGINSLFSILACTLFLAFWVRRSIVLTLLLVASAVGWVLAVNVLRVVLVVYSGTVWGFDLATGWRHEALGMGLFGVALFLVWSTDRLLVFLTAPNRPLPGQPAPTVAQPVEPDLGPTHWGFGLSWMATAAISLAYLSVLGTHVALYGAPVLGSAATASPALEALDATVLPEKLGVWQRCGFETQTRNPGSAFGEASRVWTFQGPRNQAFVSLDYPFPTWHDLTRCYTSQGWQIEAQNVSTEATQGAGNGLVEVVLTKPAYRSAYLLLAQFDAHGTVLEARRGGMFLSLHRHDSALRRLTGTSGTSAGDPPGPIYQLQLFVESPSLLTPAEQAEARVLFLHALEAVREAAGTPAVHPTMMEGS